MPLQHMTAILRITIVLVVTVCSAPTVRLAAQARSLAIHEIQGTGARSPFEGQLVVTTGVVTARRSNGVFIQTPESDADADARTSQGLLVFTGAAPAATLTVGTMVTVTGRVLEFVPAADPRSPPLTELEAPTVEVRGAGATLPAPVELTAAMTAPTGAHDALERFEGMRVRVASLTVVSPTLGTITESSGQVTSNGVFYGVITGLVRPFREPGVDVRVPLPPGSPCCVPTFDGNPERLRVDSDGQPGAPVLNVATGAVLRNVVGPLDYGFQTYTILPDVTSPPAVEAAAEFPSLRAPGPDEYTIATLNLQRLFDASDEPNFTDVVLTNAAFQARLAKLSLYIRRVLQAPDLLGVQEVENLATLQTLAAVVNRDAVQAGESDPGYEAYVEEGNDPGGIDVGVLVKRARVEVLDHDQVGKSTTFTNPTTNLPEPLNDRPPLVLVGRIHGPFNARPVVTLIVNHLRSLIDVDSPTEGARVRAKRAAQAEYLADIIQQRTDDDPNGHIVVVGDLNAFQFSDGYVDVVGTIRGAPSPRDEVVLPTRDRVEPNLATLIDTLAPADRYSYVFDGSAQTLDHVLISESLRAYVVGLRYARGNADAPEVWRTDVRRPERVSDHDGAVLYVNFFPPR
jgi:uncharacterized protein